MPPLFYLPPCGSLCVSFLTILDEKFSVIGRHLIAMEMKHTDSYNEITSSCECQSEESFTSL